MSHCPGCASSKGVAKHPNTRQRTQCWQLRRLPQPLGKSCTQAEGQRSVLHTMHSQQAFASDEMPAMPIPNRCYMRSNKPQQKHKTGTRRNCTSAQWYGTRSYKLTALTTIPPTHTCTPFSKLAWLIQAVHMYTHSSIGDTQQATQQHAGTQTQCANGHFETTLLHHLPIHTRYVTHNNNLRIPNAAHLLW